VRIVICELVVCDKVVSDVRERLHKKAAFPIESLSCGPNLVRTEIVSENGIWVLPGFSKKTQKGLVSMKAVSIKHTIPTVGYVLQEQALEGAVDVDRCLELGLRPGPAYAALKRGHDVTLDNGIVVRAADVVAPATRGRKLVILGDTCDASAMIPHAADADLVVHEATVESDFKQVSSFPWPCTKWRSPTF
jgi:ribonuclease Z